MNAIKNLKAAYEAAARPTRHALLVQHEMDDEPDFIVWDDDRDAELITVAEGNTNLAEFIAIAHNMMPELLGAVEALRQIRALAAQAIESDGTIFLSEADVLNAAQDALDKLDGVG